MTVALPAAQFAASSTVPAGWSEIEADPIVSYDLPTMTEYGPERVCPTCADKNGAALDSAYHIVRASEFSADTDDHDAYAAGRCCSYCGTPFPGQVLRATTCPRTTFCAECD